jgi:ribosome-binding protein aMBF1 (putative translation factor)
MTLRAAMGISNPRKEDGSIGDLECDFCGTKGVTLLGVMVDNAFVKVCKNCLEDGIEIINKTILTF